MVAIYQPTAELRARAATTSLSAADLVALGRAQPVSDRHCTDDRRIRLVEYLLNATALIGQDERPSHGWRFWRAITETEAEYAYYKAEIAALNAIDNLSAHRSRC